MGGREADQRQKGSDRGRVGGWEGGRQTRDRKGVIEGGWEVGGREGGRPETERE